MQRPVLAAALVVLAAAHHAQAQGIAATYGAYNAGTLSLNPGAFAPLQLDQAGNVKTDCVLGCAGTTAGTAAGQGAPASAANAWPVAPIQAGAPISAGNPLYVQDPFDGTPITGANLPSGGSGILGWLSAMYKLEAGTLSVGGTVSIAGITGAPNVTSGAIAASTAVLAAEPANVNRLHFVVLNLAAAGGASLYCTDDGSIPAATSASFIVYAQGFYERDTPAWVPSTAINCVPASGTVNYRAESYP